jgi:SulP family sulfate permease
VPSARRRRFERSDVVAGASVALVLIPQSLAYAELAGLPGYHGLYAAAAAPLAAAFFVSSPYLQTGPVALTSLLTLGALVPIAATGDPAYAGLAALLAIVVGVVRIAIGRLRAGWVSYLMSRPMMAGFTAAAAILIVASQLPGALGVESGAGGVLEVATLAASTPAMWDWRALFLAAFTLTAIYGLRRLNPRMPGVLVATVFGIGFSMLTGYTGPTVGRIPGLWTGIELDLPWTSLHRLFIPGTVIALVGFAEAATISRMYASRERMLWNPDREFVSQGIANVAAGIAGGLPVGGSFSRSSLGHMAGARSGWSGFFTGLTVLAFLPLAFVLAPLPKAVLSAIVISATAGLIDLGVFVRLWRISRPQALVGGITFGATLWFSPRIELAVVLGIVLSIVTHMARELRLEPHLTVVGETLELAPSGVLWFASGPALEPAIFEALDGRYDLEKLRIRLGGLGRIDLSGALILERVIDEAKDAGLTVEIVDEPPHAERVLDRVLGWSVASGFVYEPEADRESTGE